MALPDQPENISPPAPTEKFTLPTSTRASHLNLDEPQVFEAPVAALSPEDEEAAARVREREAKARLRALRRIEWVGIAIATVLIGSAVWAWRSQSDADENRRTVFNGSPLLPDRMPIAPGAGAPAQWRAARPDEVKEASAAIKGQLDAFKRDDFEKAASWQSQDLKMRFGSVSNFRRAIKEAYPVFAAYKSVSFGPAQAQKDGAAVRILARLRGPNDEDVPAAYILVREKGAYRIASVSTSSQPPQTPRDSPGQPPQAPQNPQGNEPQGEVI